MTKRKNKRYKSVSEMVRNPSDDSAFADEFDERIAARQIVRSLFAKRAALGMSQQDLAEKLNCTQSRISKLEKGDDEAMRLGDLAAYADAMGFQLNVLLTKKGTTVAAQVKHHAICIKELLDKLAQLALASDDPTLTKGINHFFGEAKYNLGLIVQGSADLLQPPVEEPSGPRPRSRIELKEIDTDSAADNLRRVEKREAALSE